MPVFRPRADAGIGVQIGSEIRGGGNAIRLKALNKTGSFCEKIRTLRAPYTASSFRTVSRTPIPPESSASMKRMPARSRPTWRCYYLKNQAASLAINSIPCEGSSRRDIQCTSMAAVEENTKCFTPAAMTAAKWMTASIL
jgi:hypothetical protein